MNITEFDSADVSRVPIALLRRRHQVRRVLDTEHVERLAEVLDRCPPIVLSADGTIIDGEHRVAAARQLGISALPAIVMSAEERTGADLISAIEANTSHGLSLTREERRDAISAVLTLRPEMSDRGIARTCGVTHGLVATVRASTSCSGGSTDHLNGRLGGDGKRYGAAPPGWQVHLEALVRIDPAASVRALAEHTGASVGTVQARRRQLLEQLETEPRILRWWRRLRARSTLRGVGSRRWRR